MNALFARRAALAESYGDDAWDDYEERPISPNSVEYGWVTPTGKVIKRTEQSKDGHADIASEIFHMDKNEAVYKGYVRWAVDRRGNTAIELVPTEITTKNATKLLQTHQLMVNKIWLTFVVPSKVGYEGHAYTERVCRDAREAIQRIKIQPKVQLKKL